MGLYAAIADLTAYGLVVTDNARAERAIAAGERVVDDLVGPWSREANGRKFGSPATTNQKALTTTQKADLAEAVCAHVEYRAEMGEAFFTQDQHAKVKGPDYETEGHLDRVGPKVREVLRRSHLVVRVSGRAAA